MDRGKIARHITSHTIFNVLANLSRIITGLVIIYIARKLGPTQYGIVSTGLSVAAIAGLFCDFDISTSTACFLAQKDYPRDVIYQCGLLLNIVFSLTFSLILFLLAEPLAKFINIGSDTYITIVCIFTLFTSLFYFSTNSLQGIKQTDKIALLNFLQSVVTSTLIFVVAYVGYKAAGVLYGYSIATMISWIIAIIFLRKYFNLFKAGVNAQVFKRIFLYALPLLVTSSSYLLLLRGPVVLLSVFAEPSKVAYLNIPMRIVELGSLPAHSLAVVIAPFFTQEARTQDNLQWLYKKIFKYAIFLYLPISLYVLLASNRIIVQIFGLEYSPAIRVLFILSFYLPFFAIAIFTGKILDFLGFAKQKSIVFISAATATILSSIIVIPILKEIGAALVIAVPYTIFSIYTIVKSSRACSVQLSKYVSKAVYWVIALLISGLPTYAILQSSNDLKGLIISFIVFFGFFIISGMLLHLVRLEEFRKLMRTWK